MRKVEMITLTLLLVCAAAGAQSVQQRRELRPYMGVNPSAITPELMVERPQVTERTQIAELQMELRKEMLQIGNEMAEKRAQLRILQQADNPDLMAINAKIDEITALENRRMKMSAEVEVKIRSMMTDGERLRYDTRGYGVRMRGRPLR